MGSFKRMLEEVISTEPKDEDINKLVKEIIDKFNN